MKYGTLDALLNMRGISDATVYNGFLRNFTALPKEPEM